MSLYVSGGWGEPLCMAGRTETHKHFFPLVPTPDSLFRTSALLGTLTVTATCSSVARSPQDKQRPPVKEFLAVSRPKFHPPVPDLMRQSHTGSEQQQKNYVYIATSTMEELNLCPLPPAPKGISNRLNSDQGVQLDWMAGQPLSSLLHLHISALGNIKLFILTLTWRAGWGYVLGGQDRAAGWLL